MMVTVNVCVNVFNQERNILNLGTTCTTLLLSENKYKLKCALKMADKYTLNEKASIVMHR